MTPHTADNPFEQIARKLHPRNRLLRAWTVTGGISAQVTALEMEGADGERHKAIVRLHGEDDRAANPDIAADEFRLLRTLRARGLPVPTSYFFDASGAIFPIPYVVIEFMEGKPEFAPADVDDFARQMALCLAQIHRVDGTLAELAFLPLQAERFSHRLRDRPAVTDDSLAEGRIRDTLEAAWPLPQRHPTALLHGDYWPGNLLWQDGRLAAVIDWEDAARGDPLADVSNARLEMLWTFGEGAMRAFTEHYQAASGLDFSDLPYWDLYAALRHIRNAPSWPIYEMGEAVTREGVLRFVAAAFEALARR